MEKDPFQTKKPTAMACENCGLTTDSSKDDATDWKIVFESVDEKQYLCPHCAG